MQEQRLFYLLHKAHRHLFKHADTICLEELGVTSTQLSAIFYLMQHDGCLLKELGRGLSLNNSGISGLVTRMEKLQLVARKPCELDARGFRIYLTDKAKLLIPDGYRLLNQLNGEIEKDFSQDERDTVLRFLDRIANLQR
ncbi:MAG: MarR family winged helix-turn-helix transcriptional regulator [Aestuariibacter sp.]